MEQSAHDAAVEARKEILGPGLMTHCALFENADGGPGSYQKRDDQGEKHCGGGANRDGAHVGSRESAHKSDGENRTRHSQGRKDGWVPHFVHCFHRNFKAGALVISRHSPMPNNVFYHDNRVVDKNPNRED